MIPFNKPTYLGCEEEYIRTALTSGKISGDGYYSKLCTEWFTKELNCKATLLTPSCTHALELSALLLDINSGDEVIMPSYTFVSTANAFVLRGAKIVFVDIRPDTMNIDENKIEAAITNKTKVIVPVHYAGVACEMDKIMQLSEKYNLYVVEDAAQGFKSFYKGKPLGSIGHLGTFSFHETKNCTSGGEGGLLIINDETLIARAEIIREKGTNRSQFFRGMVDKYSWIDIGSSYLPSEIQSAYLYPQLIESNKILENRLSSWNYYYNNLLPLENAGLIQLPKVDSYNLRHNAHIFHIKLNSIYDRARLIDFLLERNIQAVFHYIPLHDSISGMKYGRFSGIDENTTKESERLLRLPLFYKINNDELDEVIKGIFDYFEKKNG